MQFVTSFFNPTLCRKNVTRFWPLWAAYLLMWLLLLPVRLFSALQRDALMGGSYQYQHAWNIAEDLARDMREITLIAAIGMGLLAAMALFSYLYSPRSANFMGSLPLKRDTVFCTHYLTGLAFFLVPNLLIFVLMLGLELIGGCLSLPPLLAWLASSSAMGFFFYSFAVLLGQICGHLLALPAFFVIFNGLAAGLYLLFQLLLNAYYYGFHGMPNWMERLVFHLTPVLPLSEVSPRWAEVGFELRHGWYLLLYTAVGAAFVALAWLACRRRRMESAGDVVAVQWLKPVFQYSVALCSGLSLGVLTGEMLSQSEVGLTLSVLLWTFLGGFIARMLLDKNVKVFSKWREPALAAAIMLVACVVFLLDLTGYEDRLPNPDRIAGVSINGVASFPNDSGDRATLYSEDPALIATVVEIHRSILEGRHDGRNSNDSGEDRYTSFQVTYTLTNGTTLRRRYSGLWQKPEDLRTPGTMTHAMQELVQLPAYLEGCYHLDDGLFALLEQGGYVEQVNYHGEIDGEGFDGAGLSQLDNMQLALAILQDIQAGRAGQRSLFGTQPAQYAYVYLDGVASRQIVNSIGSDDVVITSAHLNIFLTPAATKSWPLLMEMQTLFESQ